MPEDNRARNGGPPPPLTVPVTVITPIGDVELGNGSLLIGRLPECDVLLQDTLVSRMHARISVQNTSVVVEDLHSTNGVYVNGRRVSHSAMLREGDRILIGTTEISLFESQDASLQRLRIARRASSVPAERITPVVNPSLKAVAETKTTANPTPPKPATVPAKPQ